MWPRFSDFRLCVGANCGSPVGLVWTIVETLHCNVLHKKGSPTGPGPSGA